MSSSSSPSPPSLSNTLGGSTLDELQLRRYHLTESLKSVERQIFDLEENYLRDSNHYGNVVKGWELLLTAKMQKPSTQQMMGKKIKVLPSERIFSKSSLSAPTEEETQGHE